MTARGNRTEETKAQQRTGTPRRASKTEQGRLEAIVSWVGGGLSSAFFSSLERTSCVGLSVTEDSDTEDGDGEVVICGGQPNYQSSSDLFKVEKFHHVEFWCGDASNTWRRFSWGLGLNLVAKSDLTTGNSTYCSYVIQGNDLVLSFTAPYSQEIDQSSIGPLPHPGFNPDEANAFFEKHGLAVRAVGVLVDDAERVFRSAVENGAIGILEPVVLTDKSNGGKTKLAELNLYGDVVLRLVSNHGFTGPYLPNYEPVESLPISYGIERLDHAVGTVSQLVDAAGYLRKFTGFHKVTELVPNDKLGTSTAESGLKSLVLANNGETVVLHLNEAAVAGESQFHSFLDHNEGAGVNHLGLACDDIFSTVKEMWMRGHSGGFEFMPGPPSTYYKQLATRVRGILTEKQCKQCEELGIVVCKDETGVVLRAFTKSLGDRPTIFIEVIQRLVGARQSADGRFVLEEGCKGAKVNCSKLFEAIENKRT